MVKIKIFQKGKWEEVEVGFRTLNILRGLEKWGVLGLGQVEGFLFPEGLNETERMNLFFNSKFQGEYRGASYKAVKYLEELGLVEVQRYTNMPRLYNLTKDGHRVLKDLGLRQLEEFRGPVTDSMVKHEALVSGIGLVISELLARPVSTEFERQVLSRGATQEHGREAFPLPDLWVADAGQPKAIEVERTQKSAERYRKLWSFYRDNLPGSAVVLYITEFPNGPRLLLSRARKLLADFIYACGLEEFRASLGRCAFVGYRGAEVHLEKRPDHPQGPHHQRVAMASLSARPGSAGPGEKLPIAPFAAPPRSIRIGELIRPRSRPDQSASPLEMRPFPRPHPLAPSPSPEGEGRQR